MKEPDAFRLAAYGLNSAVSFLCPCLQARLLFSFPHCLPRPTISATPPASYPQAKQGHGECLGGRAAGATCFLLFCHRQLEPAGQAASPCALCAQLHPTRCEAHWHHLLFQQLPRTQRQVHSGFRRGCSPGTKPSACVAETVSGGCHASPCSGRHTAAPWTSGRGSQPPSVGLPGLDQAWWKDSRSGARETCGLNPVAASFFRANYLA